MTEAVVATDRTKGAGKRAACIVTTELKLVIGIIVKDVPSNTAAQYKESDFVHG